jgi:hypothetical protein
VDPAPVLLEPVASADGQPLREIAAEASQVRGSAKAALELATRLADLVELPGRRRTRERWELLATLGAHDLTAARICEFHLDALAIIDEAIADGLVRASKLTTKDQTWGVFAAEGTTRLEAGKTR